MSNAAVIAILVAALCGVSFYGGVKYMQAENAAEIENWRQRETVLLKKLSDEDKARESQTRERVRVVQRAAGPCLDTHAGDDVLRVLPGGNSYLAKPKP